MRKILFCIFFLIGLNTIAQTPEEKKISKAFDMFEKGKTEKSINSIKSVLAKDRKNLLGYFALEAVYLTLGDYTSLRQNYNEAIAWVPQFGFFYYKRGLLNLEESRPKEAIRDFSDAYKLIRNDSINFHILKGRANAKSLINDQEGAYKDYLVCYKYDSTDTEIINNLAACLGELGKHEESLKYLFKVVVMDPTKSYPYLNIGFQYQYMEDYEKSIEYFNKAIDLEPSMAYAYSNRSYSKLQLGDIDGSKIDIEKSIKLDPTNSYAYRNKAHIFLKEGNINAACEQLQIALKKGFTTQYGPEVKNLSNEHCK